MVQKSETLSSAEEKLRLRVMRLMPDIPPSHWRLYVDKIDDIKAADARAKTQNGPQFLYHGSDKKLQVGDFLEARKSNNNRMTEKIIGVFATDIHRAKMFAIHRAIGATGGSLGQSEKTMIVSDIKDTLDEQFYIYAVDAAGFKIDESNPGAGEYIKNSDAEIKEVMVFDVADEVEKGGWKVYEASADELRSLFATTDEEYDKIRAGYMTKDREIDIAHKIAMQRVARRQNQSTH